MVPRRPLILADKGGEANKTYRAFRPIMHAILSLEALRGQHASPAEAIVSNAAPAVRAQGSAGEGAAVEAMPVMKDLVCSLLVVRCISRQSELDPQSCQALIVFLQLNVTASALYIRIHLYYTTSLAEPIKGLLHPRAKRDI